MRLLEEVMKSAITSLLSTPGSYSGPFLRLILLIYFLALAGDVLADNLTITRQSFGLHIHRLADDYPWPTVEFGYLRLWDARVTWADVEPRKGQFQFSRLDAIVERAARHNVNVILTLGQTPTWASSDPSASSPYCNGCSSEPKSLDDWRAYVETLGKRYRGRIHVWEVWNEINVPQFWRGSVEKMVEMERIAASVLKEIDPQNFVLTPSVQGGAFKRLSAYFDAGGGRHSDGIAYHFYAVTEEPEALIERVRQVRAVMTRHGLDTKPIWNTEIGWLIPNSDGGFGRRIKPNWSNWRRTGWEEAAGFVMRSFLLLLSNNVPVNVWYAWDDGALGLSENHGSTLKPAAHAYLRAQEWLIGTRIQNCAQIREVWQCTAEKSGTLVHFVWARSPREFKVPEDWNVRRLSEIMGGADRPASESISVGPLPLMLSP